MRGVTMVRMIFGALFVLVVSDLLGDHDGGGGGGLGVTALVDPGFESPLGIREGYEFIINPVRSMAFVVKETFAVFLTILFPVTLYLLFWDPADTEPGDEFDLTGMIESLIVPKLAVRRLYMMTGAWFFNIVIFSLPIFLWPFYADTYEARQKAKKKQKKKKPSSNSPAPTQTKDVSFMTGFKKNICPQCLLRFGFLNFGIYLAQLVYRFLAPNFVAVDGLIPAGRRKRDADDKHNEHHHHYHEPSEMPYPLHNQAPPSDTF